MATIKLNGKEYGMNFGFKALRSLEKHFGKPVAKLFDNELKSESLEIIAVMYWASLQKNGGKKLTIDDVEDMLDSTLESGENDFEALQAKLDETIRSSRMFKEESAK